MKRHTVTQWLTRAAWIIFVFDWMLVLVADFLPIQGWGVVIYGVWLLLSMPSVSLWLVWQTRAYFPTRLSLLISIALLYIGSAFVFGYRLNQPTLSFILTLIFWNSIIVTGLTMALFLWKHDFSIQFIGLLSLLLLWGTFFVGRSQGTVLQLFICNNALGKPCDYWFLAPLLCLLNWAFLLGIISFVRHTIYLLQNEW